MPLVVPNTQSDNGTNIEFWMGQLLGKKIGDASNETTFAKSDLPEEHRIIPNGQPMTLEFKPERLNIHTEEDGTVSKVTHG